MYVDFVELTDFRSYPQVDLRLNAGVTTFVGLNGHGKTNLVEAIGYAASLSSHRVATDAPLVRAGAPRSIVRVSVMREDRPTLIEIEITAGRANRARINRSPVSRPRDVLGTLRTVLFAPEDLALVKGDPSERRLFLDDLLVARAPRLSGVRADYERVLKQRNALLKSAAAASRRGQKGSLDLSTLDVWDAHLARSGAALLWARLSLVGQLHQPVASAYSTVADSATTAGMNYRSSVDEAAEGMTPAELEQAMLATLAERRSAELERGVSLVGPHRDELALSVGELPAKGYASHGESWSVALSLRLAAYELLTADGAGGLGGQPVLILDDVFAELDVRRRQRLAELVVSAEQVLVTAAVPDDVPSALMGDRVSVDKGVATRDG